MEPGSALQICPLNLLVITDALMDKWIRLLYYSPLSGGIPRL